MPVLLYADKAERNCEFAFKKRVVIGRGPTCDLRLDDEHASRTHAMVYEEAGAFFLKDLESRNGTRLNGEKVLFAHLGYGDEIRVGHTRLFFVQTAPSAMVGATVGGYKLLELLGAGGMGIVFRARRPGLKEDVALKVLHPRLTLGGRTKQLLKRTHEVLNWYDLLFLEGGYDRALVYMYGLLEGLKERERVEMADRLSLTGRFRRKLLDDRRRALRALSRLKEGTSAVEVYWTLEPFGTEVLLFILASAEDKGRRKLLSQFISQWRKTKVALTGRELQELGLPPGPLYQKVFKRLLEAHLQGEVKDKADEVELVRREFLKVEDPP